MTTVANSGTSDAAINFVVKTAALASNAACTITTDQTTTTSPTVAQAANLGSRKIAATIAASQYADAAATTITTSTATSLHAFTTSSLTVATPTQGSTTALTIAFTASQALAVGDKGGHSPILGIDRQHSSECPGRWSSITMVRHEHLHCCNCK
jgi:hypothetical protein